MSKVTGQVLVVLEPTISDVFYFYPEEDFTDYPEAPVPDNISFGFTGFTEVE